MPDEFSGEVPLAFVVVKAHVAERVAAYPRAQDELRGSLMKVSGDGTFKALSLTVLSL